MQSKKYSTFICILTNKKDTEHYNELIIDLTHEFGEISLNCANLVWTPPIEYVNEMGNNLQNELLFFESQSLKKIIEMKHWLMFFEDKYSVKGNRQFNLNPGYFSNKGMFLLTHKPSSLRGRIKLEKGIWREKQYDVLEHKFIPTSNTFSEFGSSNRISFFSDLLMQENITALNNVFDEQISLSLIRHKD